MKKTIFPIIGAFLVFSLFAQEIPQKISYQGKLMQNGDPVNGTKDITFTIGSWSETHSSVEINNGLYSVTLGSQTPIPTSIFDNSTTVELEISVEGSNLSPNTDMLSVPYAYKAQKAVEAGNTFSGDYNDLINTPNFANVATSGDYTDLSNIPDFSGWDKDTTDDLSIPINEIHNGDDYAINITSQGSGGIASFYIPKNSANALYVKTDGTGKAARFVSNPSDAEECVSISSWSNNFPALEVDNDGSGRAAEFDGGVYIYGGDLDVDGSKNFVQEHPHDSTKEIVYSSLEGPESATFIRGKDTLQNGEAVIQFPEHYTLVTAKEGLTAQLTPGGNCNGLYVKELTENKLVVKELQNGSSNAAFHYLVHGVRQGYEDHQVIREKENR